MPRVTALSTIAQLTVGSKKVALSCRSRPRQAEEAEFTWTLGTGAHVVVGGPCTKSKRAVVERDEIIVG